MRRQNRALTLLLCAVLVLFTLSTALLATTHTHGLDCLSHADCMACVVMRAANALLQLLSLLLAGLVLQLLASLSLRRPVLPAQWPPVPSTPITLKVRLNP